MHWCSLGLLPTLTFFAPMKCVWTSQQQLSRGGGAPKVQIMGHAGGLPRRTEAASWLSHGVLWLQAETGVGTFTLLDHISFESIHYSLHFATIITNVQHPSLSKAIWRGTWSAGSEWTPRRGIMTTGPRPLNLPRTESGCRALSWMATGNLPRLIPLWPFFSIFCFLKKVYKLLVYC